jgi:hypothetical protein
MKKTLLLAATLMVVTATMASAQRGTLSLGWGACRVDGGWPRERDGTVHLEHGNGPLLIGGFIANAASNLNSSTPGSSTSTFISSALASIRGGSSRIRR